MSKDLALRTTLRLPHEQAVEKVVVALKEEGFGVLTEIDVNGVSMEGSFAVRDTLNLSWLHLDHHIDAGNLPVHQGIDPLHLIRCLTDLVRCQHPGDPKELDTLLLVSFWIGSWLTDGEHDLGVVLDKVVKVTDPRFDQVEREIDVDKTYDGCPWAVRPTESQMSHPVLL